MKLYDYKFIFMIKNNLKWIMVNLLDVIDKFFLIDKIVILWIWFCD